MFSTRVCVHAHPPPQATDCLVFNMMETGYTICILRLAFLMQHSVFERHRFHLWSCGSCIFMTPFCSVAWFYCNLFSQSAINGYVLFPPGFWSALNNAAYEHFCVCLIGFISGNAEWHCLIRRTGGWSVLLEDSGRVCGGPPVPLCVCVCVCVWWWHGRRAVSRS